MSTIQWTPVNPTLDYGHGSILEYRLRENANGTAVLIANGPASDPEPFTRREECDDKAAALELAQQWEDESGTHGRAGE